ncbi:MAG: serine/threonine-protein kinase [Victivallales bacterium]
MWNIFGANKKDVGASVLIDIKPSIELLNGNCFECGSCHTVLSLMNFIPLSMEKCTQCEAPIFIPYNIKDYWLYRPLGGGGMGSVYKAIHYKYPNMEFAVKILPRDKKEDPRLIEALLKEAGIGKTFGSHPHLTPVADYGCYGNEYFSAMYFCEGRRLDQIIESSEPIPQKHVLLWAIQVLSAEQEMYDCGYLYRDLKPQNLLIDRDENAHIIDYGLCVKVEEATNKDVKTVDGSSLYMPPERICGMPENMSSEIYSLGMVMFHALARKTYYTATAPLGVAKKHVTSLRMANVANRMPGTVSPKISEILDRMIARTPSGRYQTYREAAAAIKDAYNSLKT